MCDRAVPLVVRACGVTGLRGSGYGILKLKYVGEDGFEEFNEGT